MKINYETKFDLGEEVFYLKKETLYIICDTCNGNKDIQLPNKKTIKCPSCDNCGYIATNERLLCVTTDKISSFDLQICAKDTTYWLAWLGDLMPPDKLFKTSKEAKIIAHKTNKILLYQEPKKYHLHFPFTNSDFKSADYVNSLYIT